MITPVDKDIQFPSQSMVVAISTLYFCLIKSPKSCAVAALSAVLKIHVKTIVH